MGQQNKNNINIRYIYTISPNNNENIQAQRTSNNSNARILRTTNNNNIHSQRNPNTPRPN